jgi:F-type H+-transporting ATPase subunit b
MLIDWFTVGAQALNFLVLVWLLKRFLFKPVLAAIDVREKAIAAELAGAAAKKAEADKEHLEFVKKQADADHEHAALRAKAVQEAEAERQRLVGEARRSADEMTTKRQAALVQEARDLRQSLRERAGLEVFAIARKALADLASSELEERMGDTFTRRMRALSAHDKSGLASALETGSLAVLRSAFELPIRERATIQNSLNETFSADVHVRFETAPALVCGIELTAGGLKVGWTIDGYLSSLEAGVEEVLKKTGEAHVPVDPKPEPAAAKPVATP